MTRILVLSHDLEEQLPALFAGTAVVAIVPATDLRGWASGMAWRVARAAATTGRRTVLVDCFVDAPTLHGAEGASNAEGLVDAFEYGASLNRIVQQQPQADLFFIPAGTYAPARGVMENPRWKRLSAGFRHEEALLLLYVGAEHLASIPVDPDGIIVLAPKGHGVAVADAPALAEAVAKGLPLLAVIADEDTEPRVRVSNADHPRPLFGSRQPAVDEPEPVEPRSRLGLVVATVLVALLAIGAAIRFGALDLLRRPAAVATDSTPVAVVAQAAPALLPTPPPVESLPFTLQVAMLPRFDAALALADSLEAHGTRTIVSPMRLRGRAIVYGLFAGPFATIARADSARAALVRDGLLPVGGGTVGSRPMSVALGGPLSAAAAAAERARLRRAGVATFVLGQADGTVRLYAGAFGRAVSMAMLQDLLTPTGGAGELVSRAGYVP